MSMRRSPEPPALWWKVVYHKKDRVVEPCQKNILLMAFIMVGMVASAGIETDIDAIMVTAIV